MRATGFILAAVLLAGGLVTFATAEEPPPIELRVDARVTPNKAGTPKRPRGVRIDMTAHIEMPGDQEPPLVQTIDVWFPKGSRYHGAEHPRCSEATLDRRGPSACPRRSLMGTGRGVASADGVPTYPRITVVNGGPRRVYFYTVMTNPARVQAPVVGVVRKTTGRWAYHLRATIPRNLQIVAGVPILLERLSISAGRGDWLATTSCPSSRRWPYHAEVTFATGQVVEYDDSVPCRR